MIPPIFSPQNRESFAITLERLLDQITWAHIERKHCVPTHPLWRICIP